MSWKQLKNNSYYSINEDGVVKRNAYIRVDKLGRTTQVKEMILKQHLDKDGYYRVSIVSGRDKQKFYPVHRLVAETFIDKSNFKYMSNENIKEIDINKLEVNHINEFDKKNNSVANLEWCTKLYNCNYGTRNQRVNSWKNGNRIRRR
jgi:hypothetical protein